MLDIQEVRALCRDETIMMTQHVVKRCQERGISYDGIKAAITSGEIIEQYPDDYPYPSCLILGNAPLHVVVGVGQAMLWVITAYKPETDKWAADYRTRKVNP